MEKPVRGWTLGELADLLGGELAGPSSLAITHPAPAGSGDANALTFAGDDKYAALVESSEVGAVLLPRGTTTSKPAIYVDFPKAAFGKFLAMCARPLPLQRGIHETAVVDARALISPNAFVGAFAVVERDVVIADGCRVFPFCYVGENCHLDADVTLFPHVVLYQDVRVGQRTIIHAGTILGADGFGYVWDGKKQQKVPQVGGVVVGPDCEIGALSTIDRATAGDTRIGEDTKIDNQVQVGHNTTVGDHTIVAAGSGISGSSEIGNHVVMAGMVGVGDHVKVADGVMIGARSATTVDVEEAGLYAGFPLRPITQDRRLTILYGRLPEMNRKIRELEKRLADLESKD